MRAVTVEKSTLIGRLKQNREKHRAIFLEAVEGYRNKMLELLDAGIKQLKDNKFVTGALYLPIPEDHTRDYDRVLAMLVMHQGDQIQIEETDFAAYVLDDWAWKRQFLVANSSYSKIASDSL